MNRTRHIAHQLNRSIHGEMWHGPALGELLAGVSHSDAAQHPVPGAHSIWELVLHIAAWARIAAARLTSDHPVPVTPEEDWPPVGEATPGRWSEAVESMTTSYQELAELVSGLDDGSLDRSIPGKEHSALELLHGVIDHGAYHGGQVALLKRALDSRQHHPSSP